MSLSEVLRDAVPDAPEVAGWGERAATRARLVRRRRRAGSIAGAVVAVTAVAVVAVVVPRTLDGADARPAGSVLAPLRQVPGCDQDVAPHRDFAEGRASSVRFCPRGLHGFFSTPPATPAFVSTHPLTGDAAAELVGRWQSDATTQISNLTCPGGFPPSFHPYALEITWDDGTVSQVDGRTDSGCPFPASDGRFNFSTYDDVFDDLTRAVAAELANSYDDVAPPTPTCPRSGAAPSLRDGASAELTTPGGPILELPAVAGVSCGGLRGGPLDAMEAEQARVRFAHAPHPPGGLGDDSFPGLTVLVDKTGTERLVRHVDLVVQTPSH